VSSASGHRSCRSRAHVGASVGSIGRMRMVMPKGVPAARTESRRRYHPRYFGGSGSLLNRPKSMARIVADVACLWDDWTERRVQITHDMPEPVGRTHIAAGTRGSLKLQRPCRRPWQLSRGVRPQQVIRRVLPAWRQSGPEIGASTRGGRRILWCALTHGRLERA
jgi:hypothetical protein